MPIQLWFATPIYKATLEPDALGRVSAEIDQAIRTSADAFGTPWREPKLSTTFSYERDSNIITQQNMRQLADQIFRHTELFCKELRIDRFKMMEIENSWINVSKPSGFQFRHTHEPSMVSGVYYHKTSGDDGNIVFESPNPYFNAYDFPNNGAQFQKSVEYAPSVGSILLFPSWLAHYVDVNKTQEERISLSFNLKLLRDPVRGIAV